MVTPTAKPIPVPTELGPQVRSQLRTKSSAARAPHRHRIGHGRELSFRELNLSFLEPELSFRRLELSFLGLELPFPAG